jgi:hypothetical protein
LWLFNLLLSRTEELEMEGREAGRLKEEQTTREFLQK